MNRDTKELQSHTPRKDIQGLRALAVLLVVAFHAGWGVRGGFIGVDVFFVISGFVITNMLWRQLRANGRISLRDFYSRRIRRLLPALALVVLITFAFTALIGAPFNGQQGITALTGGGAVLAVANVVLILKSGSYFETPPESNPLLNVWSLSVEEQFYLVFPFVLLLAWIAARRMSRKAYRHGLVLGVLAVFTVGSFVVSLAMSTGHWGGRLSSPESVAFYSSPTRAWEFGIGALTALLASRVIATARQANGIFTLGVVGIVLSAFVIDEGNSFPGFIALWPVLATAAVLFVGTQAEGPIADLSRSRWAVSMGDLSYSWYLWHWPLIAFALMLWPANSWVSSVAAIFAFGIAWLTFRFIENPIRFNSKIRGARLARLTAVTLAIVLTSAAVLYCGASQSWWNRNLKSMNAQVSAEHLWISLGCNSNLSLGSRPAACTLNASAKGRMIYLLGDSQAGMLSEALNEIGHRTQRPVQLGTKGACPFAKVFLRNEGRVDFSCNSFVQDSLSWMLTQRPGTAVISMWAAYTWLSGVGLSLDGKSFAESDSAKLEVMNAGLRAVVTSLRAAGYEVVLVAPIPGFPAANPEGRFWYPYQCHTVTTILNPGTCGQSRPESEVKAELAPYTQMLEDVAAETGSRVVRMDSTLCSGETCSTNTGNSWHYMDGQHISVQQSKSLGAELLTVG